MCAYLGDKIGRTQGGGGYLGADLAAFLLPV